MDLISMFYVETLFVTNEKGRRGVGTDERLCTAINILHRIKLALPMEYRMDEEEEVNLYYRNPRQ